MWSTPVDKRNNYDVDIGLPYYACDCVEAYILLEHKVAHGVTCEAVTKVPTRSVVTLAGDM